MPDKRCGTCRHYTDNDGWSGHCAVGAFLGRATAFSGETGCPGWSDGDDYARGWRDAVAAAAVRLRESADWHNAAAKESRPALHLFASDAYGIAAEAIAALTPPG